jgi:hypothetical protein
MTSPIVRLDLASLLEEEETFMRRRILEEEKRNVGLREEGKAHMSVVAAVEKQSDIAESE